MIVTINTDASFSHHHKRGSFAFWIVCNQGRYCQSGLLRDKCDRPEIAEFRCIINAVYTLGKMQYSGISKVIINTDCLNVIHLINNDVRMIRKYKLLQWSGNLVKRYNKARKGALLGDIPVEFRHVKAHVGTGTARQWVNDWCDRAAKNVIKQMLNV
jgi:ribonuclease HI